MDMKKLAPWNWFKKEEEEAGSTVPVLRTDSPTEYAAGSAYHPIFQLHRELDRIFDNAFRFFGLPSFGTGFSTPFSASGLLKPQLDIGASDKEYSITVEVPGVDEKDVTVEITGNTMTIKGEKRQEKEEKETNYYRLERSYGSFQRVLSLPEDVDLDGVKAAFRNGVLTVTIPRKALPKSEVKQVEIHSY
jgi:HSP20 family protein